MLLLSDHPTRGMIEAADHLISPVIVSNPDILVRGTNFMLKLYRKTDSVTEYWEAWCSGNVITIHWGKLGEEGESRELIAESGSSPDDIIDRDAQPVRASGFRPLKRGELHSVVVQYKVEGRGTKDDLNRRVDVEELMNQCLGWTGLGHCDGGDMGSREMNVFCEVVDVAIAQGVIVRELKSKGLLGGAVIAERVQDAYKVLWPHDFTGEFSVV